MKFIGDFHIHSHFSISTSKQLQPEYLDYWARIKGIGVIGTGDFTHPGWLAELQDKLEPAEEGLYTLKADLQLPISLQSPSRQPVKYIQKPRFILTAEISTIYKKLGRVRKVHHLIFAPDFEVVEKIQRKLSDIGNITSDGRPILGLDSRHLLELVLDCSDRIFFVPAHIWTPWFSALGAKSGFDSIVECYDDLADHIYAVEMGLSSNPPMNWLCSFLDQYTLTANSDAHSPEKLGRNANLLDTDLSYDSIVETIKTGDPSAFIGTINFYPQEGKYHYDGHRKCGICWNPVQTLRHNGICPECGKPVTVGVMNRIVQLSDRSNLHDLTDRPLYHSLIPLKEIISELMNVGPQSKKVSQYYNELITQAGTEFSILLFLDPEEIHEIGGELLAIAIERMRDGKVYIKEGFDGQYGNIRVFKDEEITNFGRQTSLFLINDNNVPSPPQRDSIQFDLVEYRRLLSSRNAEVETREYWQTNNQCEPEQSDGLHFSSALNKEQYKAVQHKGGPLIILAGPGTGKTRTLIWRIAYMIAEQGVDPSKILAVTFTQKAANEMKDRLDALLNSFIDTNRLIVSTFHSFGLSILKKWSKLANRKDHFIILAGDDKLTLIQQLHGVKNRDARELSEMISLIKQQLRSENQILDETLVNIFRAYEQKLIENNAFDLDDLIYQPVKLFEKYPEVIFHYRETLPWILIDEYQDINYAQYNLMKKMIPDFNPNLCVIGDFNQAIYGFRGSNSRFIEHFLKDFPCAEKYRLTESYRCSQSILQASTAVLDSKGKKNNILHGRNEGGRITISQQQTDRSEAEFIARTIEKMIGGVQFLSIDSDIASGNELSEITSLSDFAILCRLKEQMKVIEKALNDHNIPYQSITDIPFYRQEPIRSVLDVMRLLCEPTNMLLEQRVRDAGILINSSIRQEFDSCKCSVQQFIKQVVNRFFLEKYNEYRSSFLRMFELTQVSDHDPVTFLRTLAMGTGVDTYQANTERVPILTLHAAKGLEFQCVFIPGCEDGLLPYSLFDDQISDPMEERRLLYVGMTRARKYLFLTHAVKRLLFGRKYRLDRCPFLDSIDHCLIEQIEQEPIKHSKRDPNQLNLFENLLD